MATGTALSELLLMLKGELSSDLDATVAPGGDDVLKRQLSNQEKWLALHHDFADLEIQPETNLVAGTRYYAFPTITTMALNTNRPIRMECYWANQWNPVEPGISIADYNYLNPALNQRLDPVVRWRKYRLSTTVVQFEVWPLPATATAVRLTGQYKFAGMSADADVCVLDDLLIVQWTAAKMLARLKSADAPAMLAMAQKSLQRLTGGDNTPPKTFSMNGSGAMRRRDCDRPTVAVNYTP